MPNIVDRFGQLVDDAIPKPELARQLLLLGYRAKDVQLLLAPEKELTPARQYAAQIAMDAMIAPLAHPQRAALVNIFMPCELLHAFHLLPMFAEATACYLNGAAAERGFIHYAESAGISPTLCSYHKALLGMGLSGTAGKPLFTACTSIACDANNLTFRRLAQHYGIPHFYLDVPFDHDEYAVAEGSDRLREFAAFWRMRPTRSWTKRPCSRQSPTAAARWNYCSRHRPPRPGGTCTTMSPPNFTKCL